MKWLPLILLIVIMGSCKKEKANEEENDNELITTVELSFTRQDSTASKVFSWKDIDGAGGADPVIDQILLEPNSVYTVQVGVLDESQTPAEGITSEIREESDVHRFYFEPSPGLGITVAGYDKDSNDLPLGLNNVWTTKSSASGTMKIVLRHYPNGGKEDSDAVNSSKSTTDAEVEFPVIVAAP